MAQADLTLRPFDCNGNDTGFVDDDAFVVKECDTGMPGMQGVGKESYPAGFVDYLGAFPVLETVLSTSYVGLDPANCPESPSPKLTLFYAGTVNVFENVTAEKAQMIMSLAGGGNSSWQAMDAIGLTASSLNKPDTPFIEPSFTCGLQIQDPSQKMQSKVQEDPTAVANRSIGERIQVTEEGKARELADFLMPCQAMVPKALPLARKESLARFLERRKERVRMMAPYRGKGNQGVNWSNTSTQMLYNGFWAAPCTYTLGFNAEFVGGNCTYVEEHEWDTNHENSRQVSEGESAT